MKLREYILLTTIAVIIFCAFSAPALANSAIEVKFGPEFSLNEINILPGDAVKGNFTVTNLTDSVQNLAIDFKINQESPPPAGSLENALLIQIKKPNGNFAIMPNGTDRQIMGELAGHPFQFDALPGPASNARIYELWITFDPGAGNEYQNQKITFDISAGLEITAAAENGGDEDNGDDDKDGNGGDGEGAVTTFMPSLFAVAGGPAGAPAGEVVVSGEEMLEEEVEGAVAGEEECVPVAWWIFALILLAYWIVMYFNLFYRMKENENIRWFWEAVYTVLALVGWYYLDRCRTNVWFVYVSLISGFVIYLAYLYFYFFKKKISRGDNPNQDHLPL